MNRNQEIAKLAYQIITDLDWWSLPVHISVLKCVRLCKLMWRAKDANVFSDRAKKAEFAEWKIHWVLALIQSAKDPDVSLSSSNPNQYVVNTSSNKQERLGLDMQLWMHRSSISNFRTETYKRVAWVYEKYQFWNLAESVFDRKRKRTEPFLHLILPDAELRLNSIEVNLTSDNPEDRKNAVVSCRTLINDIANIVNPPSGKADVDKYINRLKSFVSPKKWAWESKTKSSLSDSILEDLKNKIEYCTKLTQWSAHIDRRSKEYADDVLLNTYLVISEVVELYAMRNEIDAYETLLTNPQEDDSAN